MDANRVETPRWHCDVGLNAKILFQSPISIFASGCLKQVTMNKTFFTTNETGFLSQLGLFGYEQIEPVILAALVSEEPLLLIGKAGTGKTYLLNRLSQALGLDHRHYNASLLSFDDLLGFPMPESDGHSIRYISSPSSIWKAESVLIDEINRCKPEVQNKFFSLLHERCVQGIPLNELRFRWAAMNPVQMADSPDDQYEGCEPLEPALADRFAFLVQVPDWSDFSSAVQSKILAFDSVQEVSCTSLPSFIQRASLRFQTAMPSPQMQDYFQRVSSLLQREGFRLSPRRMKMLQRNALALHSVLSELHTDSTLTALPSALFLALKYGFPQRAYRADFTEQTLEAAHATAWRLAQITDTAEKWYAEFLLTDLPEDKAARILDLSLDADQRSLGLLRWLGKETNELYRALFCFALFPAFQLKSMLTEDAMQEVLRYALPVMHVEGNLEWKELPSNRNGANPAWTPCLKVISDLMGKDPERAARAKQLFLHGLVNIKQAFNPEEAELQLQACFLRAADFVNSQQ